MAFAPSTKKTVSKRGKCWIFCCIHVPVVFGFLLISMHAANCERFYRIGTLVNLTRFEYFHSQQITLYFLAVCNNISTNNFHKNTVLNWYLNEQMFFNLFELHFLRRFHPNEHGNLLKSIIVDNDRFRNVAKRWNKTKRWVSSATNYFPMTRRQRNWRNCLPETRNYGDSWTPAKLVYLLVFTHCAASARQTPAT